MAERIDMPFGMDGPLARSGCMECKFNVCVQILEYAQLNGAKGSLQRWLLCTGSTIMVATEWGISNILTTANDTAQF